MATEAWGQESDLPKVIQVVSGETQRRLQAVRPQIPPSDPHVLFLITALTLRQKPSYIPVNL